MIGNSSTSFRALQIHFFIFVSSNQVSHHTYMKELLYMYIRYIWKIKEVGDTQTQKVYT